MSKLKLAVAVLDIGSTGVRMLVGRMMESGSSKIIAKAEATFGGGIDVFNDDDKAKLSKAVSEILDAILDKTGIEVRTCYVSIANGFNRMVGCSGEVSIIPRDVSTCQNVGELLNEASSITYPDNETLIDIVPVAYYADGKAVKGKPEGITCSTLSVDANAVLANGKVVERITEILADLNVKVDGVIPAFFSSQKVFDSFTFTDNSGGCITAIADVGGERTDISVYYNNIPFAFGTIKMGGNDITRDVALVLDVTENQAQRLKIEYCYASKDEISTSTEVEIETQKSGLRAVSSEYIADIMNARIQEIAQKAYKTAQKLIRDAGCVSQGITKMYFIGDGIAHFKGATNVLVKELGTGNVEVINKGKDLGIKNSFTNALGMILYISSKLKYGRRSSLVINKNEENTKAEEEPQTVKGVWNNIKAKAIEIFEKVKTFVKQTIEKLKS